MPSVAVILDDATIVDAFAYRSKLYCWTLENQLQIYRINAIIAALERQYGPKGLGVAYGLFSSRGIGASRDMRRAFRHLKPGQEPLNIAVEPEFTITFSQSFNFLLDFRLYYDRLYMATEKGTFAAPADDDFLQGADSPQLEVLHEEHSYSLSTGLRAVATSLGKLGLSIIVNEPNEDLGRRTSINLPGMSVRSMISASRVANFPSNDQYVLYRTRVSTSEDKRDIAISDVFVDEKAVDHTRGSDADGYAYWDGRHKRVITASSTEVSAFMPATGNASETVAGTYQLDSEPLSVSITGNNYVTIETVSRVVLTKHDNEIEYVTGPCLSVRTYKGALRFRRLVTCSAESGLWLIAAYGEDEDTWTGRKAARW